jgi:hypothetical protein
MDSLVGKIHYYVNYVNDLGISFLFRFGSIFNLARLVLDDYRGGYENGSWWQRLFNGYSITTWMVVLNLGSTGLLVSWLMKYADNIVKVNSLFMASSSYIFQRMHTNMKISISAVRLIDADDENSIDLTMKRFIETRMLP